MRKFYAVVFAMLAVFAFGAAATASAETTLLAEWLVNKEPITTLLSIEILGSLKLQDTNTIAGSAAVTCTGILDGSIGPNGEGEITEVLKLTGTVAGELGTNGLLGEGAGTDCVRNETCLEGTAASPIEVNPLGLPWLLELFLMVGPPESILALITSMNAGGLVGYELLCLVLGINAEDTCTQADGETLIENEGGTGDAETPAGQKIIPNALCSSKETETGINESTELAEIMPLNPGTELITVSSEGFGV